MSQVELLGYAETGMTGEPATGSLAAAHPSDVVPSVWAATERFSPSVLVTLDAGDGHRDHAAI